jgi:succinoglycan biosynthesis protein ExoA
LKASIPTISVIVPCRNEKDHIESCVRSILAQKPPLGELEILVVDGLSEDGTRDILANIAKGDPSLRVLDNPSQTTPAALNIGIQASRGQYVAILGAHAEYALNYLQTCLELLQEHPEVCCAGGPIISRGKGPFGQAVAEAMSHPVGVGNAKHRLPDYEGYAEGACFPMFRKEIFKKVGLFDERFICTEDDELNYRLARGGDKVFISPRARCTYFVRETPLRLFRQYFRYGAARVAVLRKYRLPASFRQIVPPVFIGLVLISLIVGLWLPGWWRLTAIVLPLLYGVALLAVAAGVMVTRGWLVGMLFPLAAAIMHVSYALGFAWGNLKGNNQLASSPDGQPIATIRPG